MPSRSDDSVEDDVDLALVSPELLLENDRAGLITGLAIARSWRDPAYRDRLLTAPKAVLAEDGLHLPEQLDVRVFEDTEIVKHVNITRWTSEPEELARALHGLLPLPAGREVRVVQNTDSAVCLVIPVAAPEPETLTDVERLRKLAPRAAVFASAEALGEVAAASVASEYVSESLAAESVAAAAVTQFGNSGAAAAAATAHASTETETATATAAASGLTTESIVGGGQVSMYGSGSPGSVTMVGSGSPTVILDPATVAAQSTSAEISASTAVVAAESASVSSSTAASGDASVSTNTNQVTNAETFTSVDISVVSEGASATLGVELEAVATTSTLAGEAEVVAVAVIVVS